MDKSNVVKVWYQVFGTPTLELIKVLLDATEPKCYCGKELTFKHLRYFPHAGGVYLTDLEMSVWLYLKCPKCDTRYAFHKWKNLQRKEG